VVSISPEQVQEHFGHLGFFAAIDGYVSSAKTRTTMGWNPMGPSLLADLANMRYA
jgi:hypothetical protein